jgi:arsenite methyltransferase
VTSFGAPMGGDGGEGGALEFAPDEAGGDLLRPGGLALTERALGYCELGAGARVLDLGCGTGVTVEHLCGSLALDALGVDSSRETLERGRRRNATVPLVQGSGNDLPILSGSVAAVLAECSLSVMPAKERVLSECWRVLAPGGRLAVIDLYAREPGALALLRSLPVTRVARMTTLEEISAQLEDQGFCVELWEDHSPSLAEFAFHLAIEGRAHRPTRAQRQLSPREQQQVSDAVRRARPGYLLLVAAKRRGARPGGSRSHER